MTHPTTITKTGQHDASELIVPKGTPLTPGKLYLHLFHGRTDPNQDMEDWGFAGPTFGPLNSVHQTYATELRFYGEREAAEMWLSRCDDMVVWDGGYYGDVAIFIAGAGDTA